MTRTRLLVSVLVVALAAMSIGTAAASFSDTTTMRFQISAADDFDAEDAAKVWVCKLVGPPEEPSVKPGKNPIHVSVASTDAQQGFSDAHPSYIVESGGVDCVVPPQPRETEKLQPDRELKPTTTTSTSATVSSPTTTKSSTTPVTQEPTTSTTSTTVGSTTTTVPQEPTTSTTSTTVGSTTTTAPQEPTTSTTSTTVSSTTTTTTMTGPADG